MAKCYFDFHYNKPIHMENLIFKPQRTQQEQSEPKVFAKYNLGDIVVLRSFATHCIKVGKEFHFKESAPINVSPFMVIIRADRNEKAYRVDSRQSQDFVRYRCMWYDPNKGDFQEDVFFESLLFRIASYQDIQTREDLKKQEELLFGKTCMFRTREFEMSKVFPEKQPYNRFREVVNFIPPDLIVTGFKTAQDLGSDGKHDKPIVWRNEKQEVIRYDFEHRIVCQWYSTSQGKFIKKDFIPHALSFAEIILNIAEV